jgi:hypothetical protein
MEGTRKILLNWSYIKVKGLDQNDILYWKELIPKFNMVHFSLRILLHIKTIDRYEESTLYTLF